MATNLSAAAGVITALAAVLALALVWAGWGELPTYMHAVQSTRRLSSGENGTRSKGASGLQGEMNVLLNGTRTSWTQLKVSVPKRIRHDYDPRCDTASAKFQMHNRDVLENEGISFHQFASRVGTLRILWYILKLLLALASLPTLPLEPAAEWRIDDQSEKEAAAEKFQLTKEELDKILLKGGWAEDSGCVMNLDNNWAEVCREIESCKPVPEQKDQVSAIEHAKKGALTLYAFTKYENKLVPEELSSTTWGSAESAWLALQCAVGRSVDCGLPVETTLGSLVRNRYNPSDAMPHTISVSQLLPQSADFDVSIFQSYVKMKLGAPAQIMGLNAPWSNQTQMGIFLAQVVQAGVEIYCTSINGTPEYWQSREWFCLTFRMELFMPMVYLIWRAIVIHRQCESLFTGLDIQKYPISIAIIIINKIWDKILAVRANRVPMNAHVCRGPAFVRIIGTMYYFLYFSVVLTPFMPALSLMLGPPTLLYMLPCPSLRAVFRNVPVPAFMEGIPIPLWAVFIAWAPVASHFMKDWLSRDTYICTFSVLHVFETSFDASSISGYLVVILVAVAILVMAMGALAIFTLTPSIMSPKLVYRAWVWRSRGLLFWALEADGCTCKLYQATVSAMELRLSAETERQCLLGSETERQNS